MEFSPDVTRRLFEYDYPGNVRELENLVRRLVVLRDERFVLDELRAGRRAGRRCSRRCRRAPPAARCRPQTRGSRGTIPIPRSRPRRWCRCWAAPRRCRSRRSRGRRPCAPSASHQRHARADQLNKRKAAARLQISYKALLYKIKDCGLTDPRITAGIPDLPPVGLAAPTIPSAAAPKTL